MCQRLPSLLYFDYLSCSGSQIYNKMFKMNINRIAEYTKAYYVTVVE